MNDPDAGHRELARAHPDSRAVPCAILTISDTRTRANDISGDTLETLLVAAGHIAHARTIVPDEPDRIRAQVESWIADPAVRAVLSTGGTGFGRRDTTIDVVRPLLAAELEGFGELFRMISHAQVGSAAMLSRATAGMTVHDTGGDTFVFAMPGSPKAVDLAMRELILPELGHLVWARRS